MPWILLSAFGNGEYSGRANSDPLLFIGLLSQRLVQNLSLTVSTMLLKWRTNWSTEERKLHWGNCLPEQVRLRNLDGCGKHCYKGVTGRTVIAEVVSPDARFFRLYRQSASGSKIILAIMNLEELPVISTYYTWLIMASGRSAVRTLHIPIDEDK